MTKMRHQRWYDQIIERARGRSLLGYYEIHHIVPRSLGGSDDDTNLVQLTYREHFLVHWLLVKTTAGLDRMKMQYALNLMATDRSGRRMVGSWGVEVAKRAIHDAELNDERDRQSRDRLIGIRRKKLTEGFHKHLARNRALLANREAVLRDPFAGCSTIEEAATNLLRHSGNKLDARRKSHLKKFRAFRANIAS